MRNRVWVSSFQRAIVFEDRASSLLKNATQSPPGERTKDTKITDSIELEAFEV